MTQDTKAMVEAFEAKFEADWNDPAMQADTEMWSAAWSGAIQWQAQQKCEGDPGECAFNGACMYACGRSEPPKAAPLALAESDIDNIVKWPLRMFDTPEEIARAVAKATAACMQTKYRLAAAASPPQPVEAPTAAAHLPRALRLVCKHDSFSVGGCVHCEAADVIEALTKPIAAPPAVEAGQALTEAVNTLLEEAPCDCPHKMRFERGEHLSGCYLYDLNIAASPQASPTVEPADETRAYAEGRGDQFEDDCAVVRLLLDNLNDVDVMGDGRINTTRVRELLSHFDIPRPVECSGLECSRPECGSMGCTADRINTAREQRIDEARAASRKE